MIVVDNRAKIGPLTDSPIVMAFSWFQAAGVFVWQETHESTRKYLSSEQALQLKQLDERRRSSSAAYHLLNELRELASYLWIEGFTAGVRRPVDLSKWAAGRAALLPTPFEDTILSSVTGLPEISEISEKSKNLDDFMCHIESLQRDSDAEIDALAAKYLRGLLYETEDDAENDTENEFNGESWKATDEGLLNDEEAMDCAQYGFYAWVDGLAVAYSYLHGNDSAQVIQSLIEVCKAIGVVSSFQQIPKVGRPAIKKKALSEEISAEMAAVATALNNNPRAPDKKLRLEICILTGITDRTAGRWLKVFRALPEKRKEEIQRWAAIKETCSTP